MFDTTTVVGFPCGIVVNWVECLSQIDRRNPHVDPPLLAFLFNHPVCHWVIQRLARATDPSLIFRLNLVMRWDEMMDWQSGNPTNVPQGSATNCSVASYHSLSQNYNLNGNASSSNYSWMQWSQDEHDKLTNETTKRGRYLTVAAPPKSLHYVRKEAHLLAVQLEVDVATPQWAPSPPSDTLSRHSHHPARRTSGSAWLWLRLARPDPKSQCHRWRDLRLCAHLQYVEYVLCVDRPTLTSEALRLISYVLCSAFVCFDTDYLMSCTSVANFLESLVGCPTVGKFFGCCGQIIARAIQIVL